jgi:hypothetical protein
VQFRFDVRFLVAAVGDSAGASRGQKARRAPRDRWQRGAKGCSVYINESSVNVIAALA